MVPLHFDFQLALHFMRGVVNDDHDADVFCFDLPPSKKTLATASKKCRCL
jgi:hypothetical protein